MRRKQTRCYWRRKSDALKWIGTDSLWTVGIQRNNLRWESSAYNLRWESSAYNLRQESGAQLTTGIRRATYGWNTAHIYSANPESNLRQKSCANFSGGRRVTCGWNPVHIYSANPGESYGGNYACKIRREFGSLLTTGIRFVIDDWNQRRNYSRNSTCYVFYWRRESDSLLVVESHALLLTTVWVERQKMSGYTHEIT